MYASPRDDFKFRLGALLARPAHPARRCNCVSKKRCDMVEGPGDVRLTPTVRDDRSNPRRPQTHEDTLMLIRSLAIIAVLDVCLASPASAQADARYQNPPSRDPGGSSLGHAHVFARVPGARAMLAAHRRGRGDRRSRIGLRDPALLAGVKSLVYYSRPAGDIVLSEQTSRGSSKR